MDVNIDDKIKEEKKGPNENQAKVLIVDNKNKNSQQ